jgi:hypothetical protein
MMDIEFACHGQASRPGADDNRVMAVADMGNAIVKRW